ncbi:Glycoside hydrolase family 5 protein [Mycena venus]|uniref:Glycoside hydrolase family 5 protein n=1 Tax=Mycena venus TaxID=2733690 RepID=A0A8H6Z6Z8_9AGAR|nr:Glycoside hydrolase family 5 protein [Mycena venus]
MNYASAQRMPDYMRVIVASIVYLPDRPRPAHIFIPLGAQHEPRPHVPHRFRDDSREASVTQFALASMDATCDWFFWTWKIGPHRTTSWVRRCGPTISL